MQLVEASCVGTGISDCQPPGVDSGERQLHGRASGAAVSAGMVFLLLRGLDEAKREREAVLFCLFGGILFCLKMTNIVYLVPLVLLYLWKIRKYLTPKLFLGCLGDGGDSRQRVPDL